MELLLLALLGAAGIYIVSTSTKASSAPNGGSTPALPVKTDGSTDGSNVTNVTAPLPSYVTVEKWLGTDVQAIDQHSAEGQVLFNVLSYYGAATVDGAPSSGKIAVTGQKMDAAPKDDDVTSLINTLEAQGAAMPNAAPVLFLKDVAALLKANDTKSISVAPAKVTIIAADPAAVQALATKGSDFAVLYSSASPIGK